MKNRPIEMKELFYFFIYPGLVFASIFGGLLSWFDRKVTAWVQFRKGPPILQPFFDFFKLLLVKETIVPARGSVLMFLLAPIVSMFGATAACILVLLPAFGIHSGFAGDIIVIFYLLNIPAIAYILGAMASGNPLASIGASREIKLIISYELAFLLVLAAVILKSGISIKLSEIISSQQDQAFVGSVSGVILLIVSLMCVQAKLGLVPFDIAEAETEINHGSFIEYSGTALALIVLTKYIMLFTLPAFVCVIFFGGFNLAGIGILYSILKIVGVVLLITLIRNTNPRVKIKQAMSFFFIWMNLLAVLAIVLTLLGY